MKRRRCCIIYVPGIRDDLFGVQSVLIQWWRLRGVRPVMLTMPWIGQEAFEPKLARLIAQIDRYHQRGYRVCLVGASAGASAVLNAYSQRKEVVGGVAYVCGKINDPESVSRQTYSNNPAFKTSMFQLQQVLGNLNAVDKKKFVSFYSPVDTTVPHADTIIDGVVEQKLPALRHGLAILYTLSFGSRKLLNTLKG